jgi:transcription antitermination factor NusG
VASSKGLKGKAEQKASIPSSVLPTAQQWVVIQLTALGEREKNIQLIIRSARQILGRSDIDVFVPAINQKGIDDSLTTWYSEGYVFVRHEPAVSYHKLAETNYFSAVLSTMSVSNGEKKRVYSLLTDKDLAHMRHGMYDLKINSSKFKNDQKVKITKGSYKDMPGRIAQIYDDGEKVQVFVSLPSIRGGGIFMDFPASYLQKDDQ